MASNLRAMASNLLANYICRSYFRLFFYVTNSDPSSEGSEGSNLRAMASNPIAAMLVRNEGMNP